MKIYNGSEAFGMSGPFEAESFDDLADQMIITFLEWAKALHDQQIESWQHGEIERDDVSSITSIVESMRQDFIKGLEEA